ncbi:MAG: MFS transporter [Candidatus Portiera sp.]|nr:MFS transporter [Portiera sp.]
MKFKSVVLETYFYFVCGIVMGAGFSIIGPSLPYFARITNKSLDQVSDLFLIMPLGFILGIFVFRYLAFKDWLRSLFIVSVLAHLVLLPLIPYTRIFLLMALMFFIISVGRGITNVGSNLLLLDLHKKKAAPYLTGFHFCFGVGATLAPVIVGYNLEHYDTIIGAYFLFALINLPLLLFLLKFKISAVPRDDMAKKMPSKSLVKLLALIYLYLFSYVVVEAGYGTWIFAYMSIEEGGVMTVAQAGLFTSFYWLAFTVGRLLSVFLSVYFHPIKIILAHSVLSILAIVLIILFTDNLWIMWPANIALGLGLAVIFPSMIFYSKNTFNLPPKTIGNYFIAALAGAMAGPWVLGQIFVIDRDLIFYPMLLATLAVPVAALAIQRMEKTLNNNTL